MVAGSSARRSALQQVTRRANRVREVADPVGVGLVASLARPGGNVTGFMIFEYSIAGKRLGLLQGAGPAPDARSASCVESNYCRREGQLEREPGGRARLGWNSMWSSSGTAANRGWLRTLRIDCAVLSSTASRSLPAQRERSLRWRPAFHFRRSPSSRVRRGGGLMSFGARPGGSVRRAAVYVGRILKGENPADLPVKRRRSSSW